MFTIRPHNLWKKFQQKGFFCSSYDQMIYNTLRKKIPFHERYETVDFYPPIPKTCSILNNIKENDIPFHERYETIDFTPENKP